LAEWEIACDAIEFLPSEGITDVDDAISPLHMRVTGGLDEHDVQPALRERPKGGLTPRLTGLIRCKREAYARKTTSPRP